MVRAGVKAGQGQHPWYHKASHLGISTNPPPMIKATESGAAPHMAKPASKSRILAKRMAFAKENSMSFPTLGESGECVARLQMCAFLPAGIKEVGDLIGDDRATLAKVQ